MIEKVWVVNSENPRPSHADLDGEQVPVDQPFSNGMMYPGDPAGGADETAGCTCTVEYVGTADQPEVPTWMDRAIYDRLVAGELQIGDRVGHGLNAASFGKVDDAIDVVVKDLSAEELSAELAAYDFATTYNFGVRMPVVAESEGGEFLSALVKDARLADEVVNSVDDVKRLVPEEERIANAFYDAVIANEDRHMGNWLLDADNHIILIDHGFALEGAGTGGGSLFADSVATGTKMTLTGTQRAILQDMLDDMPSIRERWDGFIDVDNLERRLEFFLQTGQWRFGPDAANAEELIARARG